MAILRGSVVDPYGHPVKEAAIYVISAPAPAPDIALLTDDQGQFLLSAPVPGRYVIGVRSERWGLAQTDVVVRDEESADTSVDASADASMDVIQIAIEIKMDASAEEQNDG